MRRLDRTLRRGSPAPKSLAARALSAIRRNGGTLLLPGLPRNWLDSAGTIAATVDNPVGLVQDSVGSNHATQPTTASKPLLRRGLVNQLTQSDFQNGVTDAPTRAGLVTASTLAGYGGAIAFGHDGSTTSFAYKNFATTAGLTYTVSVIVRMDDGLAPSFSGPAGGAGSPFSLVIASAATSGPGATVEHLGDDVYRVSIALVATGTFTGCGVIKYATNNSRTFKVTRYGLFTGTVTASEILAAGGIPLTTTAPASSALGRYAWQFDGSNDFLQTGITTGNEGWVCAGVTPSNNTSNQTIFGNGAGDSSIKGIWFARSSGTSTYGFNLADGSGGFRDALATATAPLSSPCVLDGGWGAATMMTAVDGTETSRTKTKDPTHTAGIQIGGLYSFFHPGSMSAIIHCPVLPSAADRALIRRFVGSLQGQQL